MNIKRLRLVICLLALASLLSPFAYGLASQDSGVYTYVFNLYFDQGKLVQDRDFKFPFDLIAARYQRPATETTANYRLELVSIRGAKLFTAKFSAPSNDPLARAKLSLQAQYFADAKTANFYNSQSKLILTIDLAPSGPVCNDDGFCQRETGENNKNCSSDCIVSQVTPSLQPSITATPVPASGAAGGFTMLYTLLALIILALLVWVFLHYRQKWFKTKAENDSTQNPTNLPSN